MHFDEITEYIGEFGKYQKWLYFLFCLPAISCALQTMSSVFTLAIPDHRCQLQGLVNDTYQVQSVGHALLINMSIPMEEVDGETSYSDCDMYVIGNDTNYREYHVPDNTTTRAACNNWVYDKSVYETTVIGKLDLVCTQKLARANANMIFMAGLLVASVVFGVVSDLLGRKTALLIGVVIHCAGSIAQTWAPNYAVFVMLRFFTGGSNVGMFVSAFVIGMELVGPSKRMYAGIIIEFFWCLGMYILVFVAYFIRDWQILQMIISFPTVLMFAYFWIVPESARWLLSKGRVKEAEKIIRKAAKVNKATLPEKLFDESSLEATKQVSVLRMLTTPVLLVRTLVIFLNWLVVSMVYYGLTLNVGSLGGSVYVNFLISTTVELAGYVACLLLLNRVGRKVLHASTMILGGVACLCTIFTVLYADKSLYWITVVLSNIGKFGASAAFAVIYIWAAELFPTPVRNSGMGASSMCARVGGMVSPYIADLGTLVEGPFSTALPLIVFGGSCLVAGLLSLILPETLNRKLPETIHDAIVFGKTDEQKDVQGGKECYVNKSYEGEDMDTDTSQPNLFSVRL